MRWGFRTWALLIGVCLLAEALSYLWLAARFRSSEQEFLASHPGMSAYPQEVQQMKEDRRKGLQDFAWVSGASMVGFICFVYLLQRRPATR